MAQDSSLQYSINHIFLPPKLPQEDDANIAEDLTLTKEYQAALESFAHLFPQDNSKWASYAKMLSTTLDSRDMCGDMIFENVEMSLGQMTSGGKLGVDGAAHYAHHLNRRPCIPHSWSECWSHHSSIPLVREG